MKPNDSYPLNNYSPKAMADENQRSILGVLLLPMLRFIKVMILLKGVVTTLRLLSRAVSSWSAHVEVRCFGALTSHFDS